ncbi:hypothetical protein [Chromobacterium piscinae]|uniref:hypothetical protein n=1 Tax=Chromobacterium piscinae TaxID=686831 RepID=UPI00320B43DF
MQKQHDGHLVGPTPVWQDDFINGNAPVVGATEASKKFLNGLIQGKLDMENTAESTVCQGRSLADHIETLDCIGDQLDKMVTMASMIARIAEDKDIRAMAIHIKQMLNGVSNDADVLRMDIESGLAA